MLIYIKFPSASTFILMRLSPFSKVILYLIKLNPKRKTTTLKEEEVRKIFKSSRIIGKRFRLVHVFSRNELIEVSTFRADASKANNNSGVVKDTDGKILRDNVWGSLEEDCIRRDFSINALYFDPMENNLCDFRCRSQSPKSYGKICFYFYFREYSF